MLVLAAFSFPILHKASNFAEVSLDRSSDSSIFGSGLSISREIVSGGLRSDRERRILAQGFSPGLTVVIRTAL